MKKKDYQKPTMKVVKIHHQQHLLNGSVEVTNVQSRSNGTGWTDDDNILYSGDGWGGSGR